MVITFLRRIGLLPVYRKHVLQYVYKNRKNYEGLCEALERGLDHFYLSLSRSKAFPDFSKQGAEAFVQHKLDHPYWWPSRDWDGERSEYLKHLILLYENDKTNLRKIR